VNGFAQKRTLGDHKARHPAQKGTPGVHQVRKPAQQGTPSDHQIRDRKLIKDNQSAKPSRNKNHYFILRGNRSFNLVERRSTSTYFIKKSKI